MSCNHYRTKGSRFHTNMLVCRDCGSLLDRNGFEITDDYDFFRKGEGHGW